MLISFGMQIFLCAQRTDRKFERYENFRRGGKLRSENFLLGGVHAAACGLQMKELRPLHASRESHGDRPRRK